MHYLNNVDYVKTEIIYLQSLAVVFVYLCYSNESCSVGDDISMSKHCTFWVS